MAEAGEWIAAVTFACTAVLGMACARNHQGHPGGAVGSPPDRTPSSHATAPQEQLTIVSNTQATLDEVRIGAGNFWEDEYVGAAGEQKKGPSAGLWMSVRNDPSGDRHIRVGSGSRFSAGRFAFEVLEVTSDTVRIRYASKPPESP